jgi:hypothetical protein
VVEGYERQDRALRPDENAFPAGLAEALEVLRSLREETWQAPGGLCFAVASCAAMLYALAEFAIAE